MMFRCIKLRMMAMGVHLSLFLDPFRYELLRRVPGGVYRLVGPILLVLWLGARIC